ncbi:hypothetical protein [Pseudonocardia sp. DLS-67]
MGALFGSVDIVVPDGVRARVAGRVVFGGTECEQACSEPEREIVVDAVGAFAMADVMRPGEILADERKQAREDAEASRPGGASVVGFHDLRTSAREA